MPKLSIDNPFLGPLAFIFFGMLGYFFHVQKFGFFDFSFVFLMSFQFVFVFMLAEYIERKRFPTFVKLELHKKSEFNCNLKIVADFEFLYKAYNRGLNFKFVDFVIADYSAGGVSDVKRFSSLKGFWEVVDKDVRVKLYYFYAFSIECIKVMAKLVVKLAK